MRYRTRWLTWIGLLLSLAVAPGAAATAQSWTIEEMESFLERAAVVHSSAISEGVTAPRRATLSDGKVSHDAQIQSVDISKPTYATAKGWEVNFRDYWGYNVAAYRLSRMLGLDRVPVSVERGIDLKPCAVTWWIDDVLMTEKTRFLRKVKPPDITGWNRQMYRVRVFDQLIYNTDRNLGNLVITKDWQIWLIDHTRAFRLHSKLEDPKQLVMCERRLLEAMRRLDRESLQERLGAYLKPGEIDALLARRGLIVEYFDTQAAARGEKAVLFDFGEP